VRKSSQIEATTAKTKTKNQIKKMKITEIIKGNYKAEIQTVRAYEGNDRVCSFLVKVIYMNGANFNGDVCFMKTYNGNISAMKAAQRMLAKFA
jgi:uncharacterized protein YggL (DUF469 family)